VKRTTDEALRALHDCGQLGVRQDRLNAAFERIYWAGYASRRSVNRGGEWWRVYRLNEKGRALLAMQGAGA